MRELLPWPRTAQFLQIYNRQLQIGKLLMDAPTNSFRNVRLSTLRLAVAAAGFSPATNTLDKIIDDNVTFHKHSLDGTKMAMSVAVVDRIDELTAQPAGEETATTVSQTPPVVSQTPPTESQSAPVVSEPPESEPAVDAAADLERTDGLLL